MEKVEKYVHQLEKLAKLVYGYISTLLPPSPSLLPSLSLFLSLSLSPSHIPHPSSLIPTRPSSLRKRLLQYPLPPLTLIPSYNRIHPILSYTRISRISRIPRILPILPLLPMLPLLPLPPLLPPPLSLLSNHPHSPPIVVLSLAR